MSVKIAFVRASVGIEIAVSVPLKTCHMRVRLMTLCPLTTYMLLQQ
jgi:hypothetical protein